MTVDLEALLSIVLSIIGVLGAVFGAMGVWYKVIGKLKAGLETEQRAREEVAKSSMNALEMASLRISSEAKLEIERARSEMRMEVQRIEKDAERERTIRSMETDKTFALRTAQLDTLKDDIKRLEQRENERDTRCLKESQTYQESAKELSGLINSLRADFGQLTEGLNARLDALDDKVERVEKAIDKERR